MNRSPSAHEPIATPFAGPPAPRPARVPQGTSIVVLSDEDGVETVRVPMVVHAREGVGTPKGPPGPSPQALLDLEAWRRGRRVRHEGFGVYVFYDPLAPRPRAAP